MKFATFALLATASANEYVDFAKALPKMIADGAFANNSGNGDISWTQCSDAIGKFTLTPSGCSVSPDPVAKGKTETFTIVGTTSAAIFMDHIDIEVIYAGKSISKKTQPVSYAFDYNVSFPVESVIPIFAPSGQYTIKATAVGNLVGDTT